MAEFSVSVSESVRTFGGAPTSRWNAYNWNAFKWGEGTASMVIGLGLGVSESQASSGTCDAAAGYVIALAEAFTPTASMTSGQIRDMAGYYHVFPNSTTDGEERDTPSWAGGSTTNPTWATAAASATSWS